MADGKTSFLLYCDIQSTINKLTNEKAGELFKTILSYVNDENPVIIDPIIDLVFEPIKVSLKRDLKRYESIVERNRENGKLGGRPKGKKPKKPSGLKNNPKNPDEPKKADSDSDSDSDSEREIDKKEITYTPFQNFTNWIKSDNPNVSKLEKQMTEPQFLTLIGQYGKEKLLDIIFQMENKKDLAKKYTSVYLTANNWLKP